ncbi:MAG: cytochrome c oxidase assembly protein [Alphaproteobacteria bacterium CG_4_9_14_3_um_filter_47_13]|nr:MAG: cytochrome c oxidase assembly protein [Alphaproteobacteria bacterium CG_4_9_14_3_um_filter_47_13]
MKSLNTKNRIVGFAVLGIALVMVGMAFASVPLYKLFCSVTGYGGTTQVSGIAPDYITNRNITVKFNANTAPNLRWYFKPEQHEISVHPGQKAFVSYRARNLMTQPLAGTALYNVSPLKAGKYFHKIECFCFGEQILEANQDVAMPVLFFIDPAIEEDRGMNDVTTITLSYTFFKTESPELDKALEDFYNQPSSQEDNKSTAF